jgi:hypothetical protein
MLVAQCTINSLVAALWQRLDRIWFGRRDDREQKIDTSQRLDHLLFLLSKCNVSSYRDPTAIIKTPYISLVKSASQHPFVMSPP